VSKKLQLPNLSDRVVLAAGKDAHTGSHKLAELLDRIAQSEVPPLTREETGSLRDVHAGRFKRRRGQHISHRRLEQREGRHQLWAWLKRCKEIVKRDSEERALKHAMRGHYNINTRVGELAHARLLEQQRELGEDYLGGRIRSAAALANLLKRGPN
jgi:hypothetical protein